MGLALVHSRARAGVHASAVRVEVHLAGGLPAGKRIVVISPAHNEAENVGAVIHAMPEDIEGYVVVPIVIDVVNEGLD